MSQEILERRFEIIKEIFNDDAVFNRSKNEVLVFCPKHEHHKRKLSINVSKNNYKCWVCGYAGKKIFYLLKESGTKDQQKRYIETLGLKFDETKIVDQKIELPEEYRFILDYKDTPSGISAMNYLLDIGLTEDIILQNKIGYCVSGPYYNRIIFPSYDCEGRLNFFSTRRYDESNYKKYLDCDAKKSEIIFNELFVDWSKPLILVENIKACLKHASLNLVPTLGMSIHQDTKLFQSIALKSSDVYIALDADAKQKALKLADLFKSYCVDARVVFLDDQPDEMTTEQITEKINKSEVLSFDDSFIQKLNLRGFT